ncbi:hypothetical protein GGS21DRAFT_420101 [Xylaria nigripes]|nr:hypothetical protein GGS21DRAFT_420101 [Xylaria nigripes]
MSPASDKSVYHGQAPSRPSHYYTTHPPTAHRNDQKYLQESRLSSYRQDPHHPIMASSRSTSDIEATHQDKVKRETDKALKQFYGS